MKRATKSILMAICGFAMVVSLAFCVWSALAGGNGFKVASADESIFDSDSSDDFMVYGAALRDRGEDNIPGVRFHLLVSDAFYERHNVGSDSMDITIAVKVTGESNLTGADTVFNKEDGVKTVYLANPKTPSGWVHNVSAQGYYETVATITGASLGTHLDVNLVVGAVATNRENESNIMYSNVGKASLSYVAWQVYKATGLTTYDNYRAKYTVTIGDTSAGSYTGKTSYSDVMYGEPVPASATKDGYTPYWAEAGTRNEVKYVTSDITVDAHFRKNIGSVNAAGFQAAIKSDLAGEYILTSDLDFSGSTYESDTSMVFTGVFDGNGHTIKGLALAGTMGLFYRLDGALVEDLIVTDVEMTKNTSGVIAQRVQGNSSEIKNVYVSVKSIVGSQHGAFVDWSYAPLTVSKSVAYIYAENAASRIGFVGRGHSNAGTNTVNNCVFVSNVAGVDYQNGDYATVVDGDTVKCNTTEAHGTNYSAMSTQNQGAFNNNNVLLTKDNFVEKMHNASETVLELTEDISLTSDWGATSFVFSGTFEGNGKTITGLKLNTANTGLFYRIDGATVRNVIIKDVVMDGNNQGAVANAIVNHKCEINNVYISVKSVSSSANHGAFVYYTYYPLTMSNSVVYIYDENAVGNIGYIARGHHATNGTTTVSSSVFISNITGFDYHTSTTANTYQVVEPDDESDDANVKCNTTEAHGTNYSAMSTQNQGAFDSNNILINKSNFSLDTFKNLPTVVELTEDIDLSTFENGSDGKDADHAWGYGDSPSTDYIFTGLFNGNGHTISNLYLGKNGGLFYRINGATVKNVIMKNVTFVGANIGGIASAVVNNNSYVDNVYVSVKATELPASTRGGIVYYAYAQLILTNSVVYINETVNYSQISFICSGHHATNGNITTDKCVFISNNTRIGYFKSGQDTTNDTFTDTNICTESNVSTSNMSDQNYEAYTGSPRA